MIGVAVFGTAYLGLVPRPDRHVAIHGFAIVNFALTATALVAALFAYLSIRRSATADDAHADMADRESNDPGESREALNRTTPRASAHPVATMPRR